MKQVKNKAVGQLRIIGGQWRGRKLAVLDAEGLRPTADRIRETLFNWLRPYLAGTVCLDVFAGTGALALEALSQGARLAVAVEQNKQAAKHLQSLNALAGEQLQVITSNSLIWLAQPAFQQFNLVFLDPPFSALHLVNQAAVLLEQQAWLAPEALIYVETAKGTRVELPATWQLLKHKQAGEVEFSLYQAGLS